MNDIETTEAASMRSEFLEWARQTIPAVMDIDQVSGSMHVKKLGRTELIPVHFSDPDWSAFTAWFESADWVVDIKTPIAMFELLADYLEQGIYQYSKVQSLALFEYGIWPEEWRSREGSRLTGGKGN